MASAWQGGLQGVSPTESIRTPPISKYSSQYQSPDGTFVNRLKQSPPQPVIAEKPWTTSSHLQKSARERSSTAERPRTASAPSQKLTREPLSTTERPRTANSSPQETTNDTLRKADSPPRKSAKESAATVERPRTGKSPPRAIAQDPSLASASKHPREHHWESPLPGTPKSYTTVRTYRPDPNAIGMALGSPRDNPLPQLPREGWTINSGLAASPSPTYPWTSPAPVASKHIEEVSKQKGRWKMFGGLFARKDTSPPKSPLSPYYDELRPPQIRRRVPTSPRPQITITQTTETTQPEQSSTLKTGIARDSTKRKVLSKKQKSDHKPDMQRTRSVPMFRNDKRTPSPNPRADMPTDRTRVQRSQSDTKPTLLQVEIPDVSMERYSVMFSDFLKPAQPSLMVRRQAQLRELKTISEIRTPSNQIDLETFTVPSRPATSPSPRSPSFSLFPPTRPNNKRIPSPLTLNKSMGLHRSATAPPGAVSPARAMFELSKATMLNSRSDLNATDSPAQSSKASSSIEQAKWNSDASDSTQPSPIDDSDVEQLKCGKTGLDSKLQRPEQSKNALGITEIPIRQVPKPTQPAEKGISTDSPLVNATNLVPAVLNLAKKATPDQQPNGLVPWSQSNTLTNLRSSNSVSKTHDLKYQASGIQRYVHTAEKPQNFATRNPLSSSPPTEAEISVARQISVSRRQKQLLLTIEPKTVRQPMQPIYVDVETEAETCGSGEGKVFGHMSRKSHHVLVETV